MTTLFLHFMGAVIVLSLITHIYELETPLIHRILLAGCATLPDAIDKTLTGTRYPFHSFLLSFFFLLILNSFLWYVIKRNPHLSVDVKEVITRYVLLGSIAFLTHPIMDLEGGVPLLYPLDVRGYELAFNVEIVQKFPPEISDFQFGFFTSPFDYSQTYDHEGAVIGVFDILFLILIASTFLPRLVYGVLKKINSAFGQP